MSGDLKVGEHGKHGAGGWGSISVTDYTLSYNSLTACVRVCVCLSAGWAPCVWVCMCVSLQGMFSVRGCVWVSPQGVFDVRVGL